ncbi:uncharacterized protein LOC142333196 isoform X1 [Lycorma delicatula]|uniref:uncharacterized protein LOC142333196 isoform X1 n=1 Tax=Lycorma delicatula TaxID=130591 RepID=UPI003F50E9DA
MKSLNKIILVYVILLTPIFCLWVENARPFVFLFKGITKCKNMGRNSVTYGTEIKKINSTHYTYSSNVTTNIEISNETPVRVIIKMKLKDSNKWNSILEVTMKSCDGLERFGKVIITDIFASAGLEYKCPIKKRTYMIKNYEIDFSQIKTIPVLPYGEMTAEILLFSLKRKRKVLETCIKIEGEIAPKE